MPFTNDQAPTLKKHLDKLKPGDFIMVSNGLALNNLTASNLDNAAIRLVSLSSYGHAMLYLGNGNALEMPLAKGRVQDIFSKDKSNAAAFVHCKMISTKQRGQIVGAAEQYYKVKKSKGALSYDIGSFIYGGVATAVSSAADIASSFVFQDNWMGRVVDGVLQTPATAYASAFAIFDKYPDLNCSSLVTYLHAASGHILRPGLLKHPTYCTPRNLWDAAKGNKTRFSITEASF